MHRRGGRLSARGCVGHIVQRLDRRLRGRTGGGCVSCEVHVGVLLCPAANQLRLCVHVRLSACRFVCVLVYDCITVRERHTGLLVRLAIRRSLSASKGNGAGNGSSGGGASGGGIGGRTAKHCNDRPNKEKGGNSLVHSEQSRARLSLSLSD